LHDYLYALKHIKENSLLEDVISIYTNYFDDMYKQVEALTALLIGIRNKKDITVIRNEIKKIKMYLPV